MNRALPPLVALLLAVAGCGTPPHTPDSSDTPAARIVPASDGTPLPGTKWMLVELNGAAVVADSAFQVPHLVFHADSTVSGSGGCNGLFGPYHTSPGQGLRFGDLASTQMACPAMETEMVLYELLRRTDRYTIVQDTLGLGAGGPTPVARFVADR